MSMDVQLRCDMACEILRATRDGEDLAPEHLWLVQEAVNGHLKKKGYQSFKDLYRQVKTGYKKPWLHGIENLTKDHQGFVYWKGKHVEHYSYGPKEYEEEGKAAQELSRRCQVLEKHNIEPSTQTVVWEWQEKYSHLS